MFYWNCKGKNIVLSDAEEETLLRTVVHDPLQRVSYMVSRRTRVACEKLMFAFLRTLHDQDPEEFRRRYYWRSMTGQSAQHMFPVLLDGYARAHRLAFLGEIPGGEREPWIEPLQQAAIHHLFSDAPKPMWITLFDYSWFRFWRKWRIHPICQMAIDPTAINRVVGCVENFFVSTDSLSIWFGQKRVRVFAFPLAEESMQGSGQSHLNSCEA